MTKKEYNLITSSLRRTCDEIMNITSKDGIGFHSISDIQDKNIQDIYYSIIETIVELENKVDEDYE